MCKRRIEEMRKLSKQIPVYDRAKPDVDGIKEVIVEKGIAIGEILFVDDEDRIAVAKISMEAETVMEYHKHDEIQIMTVYTGELAITADFPTGKEIIKLNAGKTYVIPSNIPHGVESIVRTRMIVQIIPASKDTERWKK